MTLAVPTAVAISFLVTALVTVAWMVWGIREYRRTGRAMWLWMGILMAVSLLAAFLRYPR